jgi:hypothetical protein
MPITVLKNANGKFVSVNTNLTSEIGWWNSVSAGDFDNDGDIDYVAGNFGNNSFLRPSEKYPVSVLAKDFDNNGSFDAMLSTWLPSSVRDDEIREFPVSDRNEFIKQMTVMRDRYPNYSSYAKKEMKSIFSEAEMKEAIQLSANNFNTVWIENKGNMNFTMHNLPALAQLSPVYAMVVNDFNEDGNLDIAFTGNEFSMNPFLGRTDTANGLVLEGNGKGNFKPLSVLESGLYLPGNGKSLAQLIVNNKPLLIAGQNGGWLKLMQSKKAIGKLISLKRNEINAILHLKSGQSRNEEFYYGSSFQSQSARFIQLSQQVREVEIIDNKNQKRILKNN